MKSELGSGKGRDSTMRKQPSRTTTKSKKGSNSKKPVPPGKKVTSKYIGVSYHANRGKWQVKIRSNGKQKHLGYFEDEDDAARAYNRAALAVHSNPKINQVPDNGKTNTDISKEQNFSLDARIQDITKQQLHKDVKDDRHAKPRRPRTVTSAYSRPPIKNELGFYHHQQQHQQPQHFRQQHQQQHQRQPRPQPQQHQPFPQLITRPVSNAVKSSPAPYKYRDMKLGKRKWEKPPTPLLDVGDEEESAPPRQQQRIVTAPLDRKDPARLRMNRLTKEVDTPTLFPSETGFQRGPPPSGSIEGLVQAATSSHPKYFSSKQQKQTIRQRRAGGIASNLKIDVGLSLLAKVATPTVRQPDAMLKLTPVGEAGISSNNPGFYMEAPAMESNGTPRAKEGPGELFPTISPAFNTYCT
mmetsp:Transcript_8551/g.12081  ORF Transcript_8551/g.12081 Transcript_8551/m.12081 type:complete len:411 (-) Transcript_8551:192-1424(-)